MSVAAWVAINMSLTGPKIARALLMAKKSPSIPVPVGANYATQAICLGLHSTSPIVMNTCHAHEPQTFGESATNIGLSAMIV